VPTVTFHHGVPLHLITMRAGYLLDAGGTVSTTRGTQHTDMGYTYVQRGGMQTFHPFDYLGFRYFQIDDPGETLSAADLVALTRHAAVPDEQAATFSSSDPGVDAVFQLGAHSALFTAQEQFIDTPTREKGPWLWDGFNESQTAMAAFSEQNLTRKSLLEFAQSQSRYWPQGAINKIYPTGLGAQDIGEFTEIYAEWVWLYWIDTGDRTLLDAVYPVLLRLSDYVYRTISPANGLVPNLPATNLYSSLAFLTRQNVLAINVFRRTGDVAEVLGHPAAEVARQRQRQAALMAAVNSHLTLANGLYVDGLNSNGTKTGTSQDSNAVAMSYGIVPPALQATVATVVASEGMAVAPRTAGELLETLRTAGRDDDFVRRLTDPKADGWANILARGGTFTWEVWQPSDANGDSMSHGWGSNVLVEIQRELLGVNVTGAGYSSFEVSPPSAGVAWASGRVPTPRGSVVVDWHRPADLGGAFTLDVTVPPNASAIVRIPALGPATISESGLPLTEAIGALFLRMDNTDAVVQVGAGTYHFISSAVPPVDVGVGLNGPGAGGPEVLPSPVAGSAVSGPGTIPGGGGPAGAVGSGASALPGRQPARHDEIPLGWDLFASVSALAAIVEIARVRRRRPGTVEAAHTGVA
jgi:alpha-L-rhamnosidase